MGEEHGVLARVLRTLAFSSRDSGAGLPYCFWGVILSAHRFRHIIHMTAVWKTSWYWPICSDAIWKLIIGRLGKVSPG